MPYSYRDGYLEGAMFLFYDGERILIEHRPDGDGTVTFVPNGKIEERDKDAATYDDYRLAALHREVDEEFAGRVEVDAVEKLCEHRVDELDLWFHCYAVTDWTGEVPDHTVEDGERFADLEWVPLAEYEEHLELGSAREACRTLAERRGRR
ncbi:NUDIX hydrolase [Halostella litorea]|uniref:NUDIX domain-containing protein n=1 Tax=Halostella litorea TaxID=2528831 RepID=UPI001092E431|nr:NUDIX domain-containing protein [Halostella litorea]